MYLKKIPAILPLDDDVQEQVDAAEGAKTSLEILLSDLGDDDNADIDNIRAQVELALAVTEEALEHLNEQNDRFNAREAAYELREYYASR